MNWEQQLGINLTSFIAGLIGGLISLTYEHKVTPLRAITLISTGGVTAGYAFSAAEHYFSLHPSIQGIFSFGIGLVAMRVIDTVIKTMDIIHKDPALILSYSKLLKNLKDDTTDRSDERRSSGRKPSVDSARTDAESTEEGEL